MPYFICCAKIVQIQVKLVLKPAQNRKTPNSVLTLFLISRWDCSQSHSSHLHIFFYIGPCISKTVIRPKWSWTSFLQIILRAFDWYVDFYCSSKIVGDIGVFQYRKKYGGGIGCNPTITERVKREEITKNHTK